MQSLKRYKRQQLFSSAVYRLLLATAPRTFFQFVLVFFDDRLQRAAAASLKHIIEFSSRAEGSG